MGLYPAGVKQNVKIGVRWGGGCKLMKSGLGFSFHFKDTDEWHLTVNEQSKQDSR